VSRLRSEGAVLDIAARDDLQQLTSLVADIAGRHDITRRIDVTDHLVDCGMTSMAMVDLMLAVEAHYDLTIPQAELTPSNFQSITSLVRMMQRVRSVGA
jgi:acyl carrier protein